MRIDVKGVDEYLALAKALEDFNKGLRKDTARGLREAASKIIPDIHDGTQRLPKRGGLAAYVDALNIRATASVSKAGKARVRIVGKRRKTGGSVDLKRINQGRLRHPIPQRKAERERGRKTLWVTQDVTKGFWDYAFDKNLALIKAELVKIVDEFRAKYRK
jgi:hypothetical protein